MRPVIRSLLAWLLALPVFGGVPQEADFTDSLFVSGLNQPTCIAWAPDGSNRLFVSLKADGIAIVENGQLRSQLFGTFPSLYSQSECGVLGLAFDPSYEVNHYVYVFVTVSDHEQQIVRFTDQDSIGTQRSVILGDLPTAGINHDGGALGVGPDGKIYFAIGDNGSKRGVDGDLTSLAAKVGRCNRDGTVPTDNPFNDGAGPNNDYIWATGFRNPFTMTFEPATGKLWLNVVGSTPDGQTQPRSGPGYEQAFVVRAGDDGGYDDYEGNQPPGSRFNTPFPRPLIRPRIQYKTSYTGGGNQVRQIAGAQRTGGSLNITTTQNHPYRVGQALVISSAPAFNGVYTVQSTPTANTFTVAADGPAASINAGQVDALPQGATIAGGCFYSSTSFPGEHRGNFFYGDYVGASIMRAQLDSSGKPLQITKFVEQAGNVTDVAVGPDGALYYSDISAGTVRRLSYDVQQGLVISPTSVRLEEGGTGTFTVRLGSRPSEAVMVQIHKIDSLPAEEHEIEVASGAALTFLPENWNVAQTVTLTAPVDSDTTPDTATFSITAPGASPAQVQATASDENLPGLILSSTNLELQEGKAGSITIKLPSQPSSPVLVRVRPAGGQKGKITIAKGSLLRFTPKNWNFAQTVRVRGNQDGNTVDQNATISVQASGYRPAQISVLIRDDDPSAPEFTASVKSDAVIGLLYEFDFDAIGLPAPRFSLVTAPDGMTIDPASGILRWTPTALGKFPVTVRAENENGGRNIAFQLTVNADQAPTAFISQPVAGATISGAASEFFGGGNDDFATTKAEFYIDGQLVYTDSNREGHYHINGAHNRFDTTVLANGSHTLKMVVYDDKNQSATASVTVTVAN